MKVRDTELWVEDTGETNLPVMLCLHSLFLDGTMFNELLTACAGKYRVICPDFRGQGRSGSVSAETIDMDTCVDDIVELIEQLGLREVNLVVQSMGGDVGLRLAHKRPELLRAMVLLGTSARAEPVEQKQWIDQFLNDVAHVGFVGETLETLIAIMFGATTLSNPAKTAMVAYWRKRMATLTKSLVPAMRGVINRGDLVELLPAIKTPALVLSGAEDLPRPPPWADELADGLAQAKHIRFAKVGHSVILEAPEKAIPEILNFVASPDV